MTKETFLSELANLIDILETEPEYLNNVDLRVKLPGEVWEWNGERMVLTKATFDKWTEVLT